MLGRFFNLLGLSSEIWYTDVIDDAESIGAAPDFLSCMVSKLRTFEFSSHTNVFLRAKKLNCVHFFQTPMKCDDSHWELPHQL